MDLSDSIFFFVALVFSAVIHEVMHGYAAFKLGDHTARYAGRLTLNPLPHIDPFGSVILPLVLILSNSNFLFAWAKPVPYNPYNLRPGRFSEAIVAGAGPLSNLVIAVMFGILMRINVFEPAVQAVLFIVVWTNILLFVFNLIPIPPLDGSKILQALLPRPLQHGYVAWRARMEMNPFIGMGLVLIVVLVLGSTFSGAISLFAQLIAGV